MQRPTGQFQYKMALTHRPGLTFGVELELVYVHYKADFCRLTGFPIGEHPVKRHIKEFIAIILNHRLPADSAALPSILGNVVTDESQQVPYAQWTVTDESSIGADANDVSAFFGIPVKLVTERCRWDPIELISPVFRFAKDNWHAQLRQVQSDLSSRLQLASSFCNYSCGLHIHFAAEGRSASRLPSSGTLSSFGLSGRIILRRSILRTAVPI